MSSDDVKKLHAEGSKAIKEKDYPKAIECFTQAIEKEGKGGRNYHKLLCNRAAVYQRTKSYARSLEDAELAVSANAGFHNAHIRKADALRGLGKFPEAIAAYTVASGCDGVPAAKLADIKRKTDMCRTAAEEVKRQGALGPKIHFFTELLACVGAIVFGVLYLVPSQQSYPSFYRAIKLTIMANSLAVYNKASRAPEFRNIGFSPSSLWSGLKAWFPKEFIESQQVHHFFPYMVFLTAKPIFIGLMPVIARSLLQAIALIRSQPGQLGGMLSVIEPQLSKIDAYKNSILSYMSLVEIYAGFMMIAMALMGGGSVIGVLMYWQYLRMSYMVAQHPHAQRQPWANRVLAQWGVVISKIDGVFLHPMCPAMLSNGYARVKGYMARMADPQTQAAAGSGGGLSSMMNSCSVM